MTDASFRHLGTAVLPDGVAEMCLPTEVMSLYREDVLADWRYGKRGSTVEGKDSAGRPSSYRYDQEGRVVERFSPSGTWTYANDGAGRLSRVRRGDGRTVHLGYDAPGRCILRRDAKCDVAFIWDGDRPVHEVREKKVVALNGRPASMRCSSGVRVHSLAEAGLGRAELHRFHRRPRVDGRRVAKTPGLFRSGHPRCDAECPHAHRTAARRRPRPHGPQQGAAARQPSLLSARWGQQHSQYLSRLDIRDQRAVR